MNRRTILLSACALLASATSANAINIVLNDTGATPMTAAQLNAFTTAANIWEGIYFDPITVNINIEFAPLGSGILGSTSTRRVTHPWSSVRPVKSSHGLFTYWQSLSGPAIQIKTGA